MGLSLPSVTMLILWNFVCSASINNNVDVQDIQPTCADHTKMQPELLSLLLDKLTWSKDSPQAMSQISGINAEVIVMNSPVLVFPKLLKPELIERNDYNNILSAEIDSIVHIISPPEMSLQTAPMNFSSFEELHQDKHTLFPQKQPNAVDLFDKSTEIPEYKQPNTVDLFDKSTEIPEYKQPNTVDLFDKSTEIPVYKRPNRPTVDLFDKSTEIPVYKQPNAVDLFDKSTEISEYKQPTTVDLFDKSTEIPEYKQPNTVDLFDKSTEIPVYKRPNRPTVDLFDKSTEIPEYKQPNTVDLFDKSTEIPEYKQPNTVDLFDKNIEMPEYKQPNAVGLFEKITEIPVSVFNSVTVPMQNIDLKSLGSVFNFKQLQKSSQDDKTMENNTMNNIDQSPIFPADSKVNNFSILDSTNLPLSSSTPSVIPNNIFRTAENRNADNVPGQSLFDMINVLSDTEPPFVSTDRSTKLTFQGQSNKLGMNYEPKVPNQNGNNWFSERQLPKLNLLPGKYDNENHLSSIFAADGAKNVANSKDEKIMTILHQQSDDSLLFDQDKISSSDQSDSGLFSKLSLPKQSSGKSESASIQLSDNQWSQTTKNSPDQLAITNQDNILSSSNGVGSPSSWLQLNNPGNNFSKSTKTKVINNENTDSNNLQIEDRSFSNSVVKDKHNNNWKNTDHNYKSSSWENTDQTSSKFIIQNKNNDSWKIADQTSSTLAKNEEKPNSWENSDMTSSKFLANGENSDSWKNTDLTSSKVFMNGENTDNWANMDMTSSKFLANGENNDNWANKDMTSSKFLANDENSDTWENKDMIDFKFVLNHYNDSGFGEVEPEIQTTTDDCVGCSDLLYRTFKRR